MQYEHIIYEVDKEAHIATVTLNKPERLNAIDQQGHRDLLGIKSPLSSRIDDRRTQC